MTMKLHHALKKYAVLNEMTMKEARVSWAKILGVSFDTTYKYTQGTRRLDEMKISKTLDMLEDGLPEISIEEFTLTSQEAEVENK